MSIQTFANSTENTPQPWVPRVLIVDDDEHLVSNLQLWFERQNVKVVSAADGHQAFQFLRESEPVDLVLTDFMMPNLNGIELLRLLKSNPKLFDTKVLVMSNNSSFEFRKRAIENGAADYVLKEIGARSIVEIAARVGGFSAEVAGRVQPAAAGDSGAVGRLQSIALLAEGLLDLLHVARLVEPMPTAAVGALDAVERIARQIAEKAAPAKN